MKLLDQSHTGWGVLSDVEVKPGATFWFVPEQGTGMRQTGTVAYCTHTPEGWRLGLRKRTLRAVA